MNLRFATKYLLLYVGFLLLIGCNQFNDETTISNEKQAVSEERVENVPVIYSSDLWLPHGDPDDHFDLLSLLSLPQLDPKAIIIDYTMQANVKRTGIEKGPNFKVVNKATALYDRDSIPVAAGLKERLKSVDDRGLERPKEEQAAVELIIEQLKTVEDSSAVIITTGSVRDIVAAFNREPMLFRAKIKEIYISMGDSYGTNGVSDTNVAKDIEAWKGLMTSGLPVNWMPTNPSKRRGGASRYVSYWHFVQEELLSVAPKKVQDFFLSEGIPIANKSWQPVRSMWSTPAFIETAGLRCYEIDGELRWLSKNESGNATGAREVTPYNFVPVQVDVAESGEITWKETKGETAIHIFKMNDYFLYYDAMTAFLSAQLDKATKE